MTYIKHALAALCLLAWVVLPADASVHRVVYRLPALFVTGYLDRGRTATGTWAGPGTCAVDARYIPYGAHITIPGVGSCVALDSGGMIRGFHVDFWFPTLAQCYAVTGVYRGATWR